jgi:hypothetical protein
MRHLLLLAVLASACDQGAKAALPVPVEEPTPALALPQQPPPPRTTIESDADFVAQSTALLDELVAAFTRGRDEDCDRLAIRVENFAGQNVTRIARLTDYSTAHPTAQQALAETLEPRMNELVQTLMPAVSRCSGNQRLMKAFDRFEPVQQQRPR